MVSGAFERNDGGGLVKTVSEDTKITKCDGVLSCFFEGTLVGTCAQWPNFTASDEFGGADFVCRAKRQLITVMQQLGNYRLSFSRFGLIIQWQSQWLANKVISTRWIKPLQCLVNPFLYHQPRS